MADRGDRAHHLQVQPRYEPGMRGGVPGKGPSASKVLAVLAVLPASGTVLALGGITFVLSLIGLMISTPVFVLFSPILVPAAITVGMAGTGFMTSGAFGLTALLSLSRVANYIRQATGVSMSSEQMAEQAKIQETAGYLGQTTKETGQHIQSKAQEGRTLNHGRYLGTRVLLLMRLFGLCMSFYLKLSDVKNVDISGTKKLEFLEAV